VRSENISYLPAVDQLRGIAALWIICYHAFHLVSYRLDYGRPFAPDHWPITINPLAAVLIEGHAAVGLFMVLSGYILTYGAWGHKIDYLNFLRNRLLRIYPLALFLIFFAAYSMPERFSWAGLWQTALLGHNLPGAFPGSPYTDMLWAVSVEFQFYLMFPLLCIILQRQKWKTFALMLFAFIVFRAVAVVLGANARDMSYLTIIGRLDQFLIGMMLGGWWRESAPRLISARWMLLVLTAWAIILVLFNNVGGWPATAAWKILWPTIEALISAAFIAAYLGSAHRLPAPLCASLQRVGLASYSLYLVHMIAITLILDHLLPAFSIDVAMPVIVVAIIFPAIFLLSAVTYFGIEKPFLSLRGRYLH
jgi:peptidoglycan/LPS O-acetylase OafA/YrhL